MGKFQWFCQSELQRRKRGWVLYWKGRSWEFILVQNPSFFLHYSLDWPISFKPSNITDLFPLSSHLIIHLNKIQPLWRWWQQAALKCQNKPIMLHGVRIQNTILWATHMVNTWNPVLITEVNEKFKIKKYTDTLSDARWGLEADTERTQYMITSDRQNADKITIYRWWIKKKKDCACSNIQKQ